MTLKPPTRTLPKVVMKEWPGRDAGQRGAVTAARISVKSLSDFTRVVEETGVLDQKETQRRKRASDHD